MYETPYPPDYSKFALSKNPFSSLSSEGIPNVEDIHVSQNIDVRLAEVLSEVIDKRAGLAISIVGDLGTGKTQRLKGIIKLIGDSGGFVHFQKVDSNDVVLVTNNMLSALPKREVEAPPPAAPPEQGFLAALRRLFSGGQQVQEPPPPPAAPPLLTKETYDPQVIAVRMREALSEYPISAVILDELENITTADTSDLIPFFESLRAFISDMPKGCIFAFACTPEFYKTIKNQFPAYTIRLHSEMQCEQLTDKKAGELVRKRLALVRTDDARDELFPFEEQAIATINRIANGNPRVLLRTLHSILAASARDPGIDLIDERYVTRVIAVPNSLEEYLMKVPQDLRDVIEGIIAHFKGGPMTYIQLSKAMKESPTRIYADLEELASMGLLRNRKGHYEILEHIREMLNS
jgi:hypothetical protein